MKRLAEVLALLVVLATPALGGRVAIIKQKFPTSNQGSGAMAKYLLAVTAVCDLLGVDYDVLDQQQVAAPLNASTPGNQNHVAQSAIRSGLIYTTGSPNSISTQYVGIIHMGFVPTNTGGAVSANANRSGGYNPDTLTRAVGWPSIPQLFFGTPTTNGANFACTATCSTGVGGSETIFNSNGLGLTFHSPGYDEAFKIKDAVYFKNTANGIRLISTPGLTKARIVASLSSLSFNTNGNSSAQWPDSVARPATYFSSPNADSAMIWTRARSTVEPAQLTFALPIYVTNGGVDAPIGLVAQAIALFDSSTGGQVIGQKRGWTPPTMAFVISGAFTRSTSQPSTNRLDSHGLQCATLCDSTLLKAGIDSLASLNVPVTVCVNVDSVGSFPYEKAWWTRLPNVRFAPECRMAVGSSVQNAGAASRYISPDPFGYVRARTLGSYAQIAGTTACNGIDTSQVCLLTYTKGRLDSIPEFNGRVGRFIMAAAADYLPSNFTRANLPGEDTLTAAMKRAGFDCAGVDVIRGGAGLQSSWNSSGGMISPQTGAPNNYSLRQRSARSAFALGKFSWLTFRGIDENTTGTGYVNHDITNEFMNGFFTPLWYNADLPYWNHEFRTRLSLFVVRPGDLGTMESATANPVRPGYHNIRWIVNQVRLVNKFAGRKVINFGFPEDIQP